MIDVCYWLLQNPVHLFSRQCFVINKYKIRSPPVNWLKEFLSPIVALKCDAFRAKVWLVNTVFDECDSLFIRESVPEAIRCKHKEHRIMIAKIKGQNIRIGDNQFLIFERIISQGSGCCENAGNPPHSVESNQTTSFIYPFPLSLLNTLKCYA